MKSTILFLFKKQAVAYRWFGCFCKCVLVPLVCIVMLFCGGLYAACYWKNRAVAHFLAGQLSAYTGLDWEIAGKVRPHLFPLRFTADNIVLSLPPRGGSAEKPVLSLPYLLIRPDLSVFSPYKRWISSVSIEDARFEMSRAMLAFFLGEAEEPQCLLEQQASLVQEVQVQSDPLRGEHLVGENLLARKFSPSEMHPRSLPDGRIRGSAVSTESVPDLNEVPEHLFPPGLGWQACLTPELFRQMPKLHFVNATVSYVSETGDTLFSVWIAEASFKPKLKRPSFEGAGQFYAPGENLSVLFSGNMFLDPQACAVQGSVSGDALFSPFKEKNALGARIYIPFEWHTGQNHILFPKLILEAENDRLQADLRVDLAPFVCSGKVSLGQLSLPRWFKFARNLPPGLQAALHQISGVFSLQADHEQVSAQHLRLFAGDLAVRGELGPVRFSQPVISGQLELDEGDLDTLFPFLAVGDAAQKEYQEPVFPHPPLIPFLHDEASAAEDLLDVGYDILVAAPRGRVHGLSTGPFQVRIHPKADDITRVAFQGRELAGGNAQGHIDIDYDLVRMHYVLEESELEYLPENQNAAVQVSGSLTGVFDIDIDVDPLDGKWSENWRFTAKAEVDKLTVGSAEATWRLSARHVEAAHQGTIHSIRENGINISGVWDAKCNGLASSWAPDSDEFLNLRLDGTVAWPAYPKDQASVGIEAKGIEKIFGQMTADGVFTVHLGSLLTPLAGKLSGEMLWDIRNDDFFLQHLNYQGMESTLTGQARIRYADTVQIKADSVFSIGLYSVLAHWDILPRSGFLPPKRLKGTADVLVDDGMIVFKPLKFEFDDAFLHGELMGVEQRVAWKNVSQLSLKPRRPLLEADSKFSFGAMHGFSAKHKKPKSVRTIVRQTAEEAYADLQKRAAQQRLHDKPASLRARPAQQAGGNMYWSVDLRGAFLDVDKFISPSSPADSSAAVMNPFDLSFADGLHVNGRLLLDSLKFFKLQFKQSDVGFVLTENNYALSWLSHNFYQGKAKIKAEGTLIQPTQIALDKGEIQASQFHFDHAFKDAVGSNGYGGKSTLTVHAHGALRSPADLPGGLSGTFSFHIDDGVYPAFIGSETLGLQNTFSTASLSGEMRHGVLYSDNFLLKGIMVDMAGGGWVDLGRKLLDITVGVTLAKVPTIPVRFNGSFAQSSMSVQGAKSISHTVQAAGNSFFSLVRGVFDLPGQALQGVGNLLQGGGSRKEKEATRSKTPKGRSKGRKIVPGKTSPMKNKGEKPALESRAKEVKAKESTSQKRRPLRRGPATELRGK